MDLEQRQQRQQTADRMTIFCLISLAIGAYIIWANLNHDAADADGTVFPLLVIAIVHLLGGSIAIYNAVQTKNLLRNLPIYVYFVLVPALAIWMISGENSHYSLF